MGFLGHYGGNGLIRKNKLNSTYKVLNNSLVKGCGFILSVKNVLHHELFF